MGGLACERLWREQPNQPPTTGIEEPAVSTGVVSGNPNASIEEVLSGSVDGYISRYFKHVAELSRESVYQAHQREILRRMRTDLIAGERSGNLKEIEEMIQKVEVEDRHLQAEITNLMRIAGTGGNSSQPSRCPAELPACVCADNSYPPLPLRAPPVEGYATSARTSSGKNMPSTSSKMAGKNDPDGGEESTGTGMPA